MTEAELLGRADDLAISDVVDGARFAVLVRSPLLIPRVRNPGGSGGWRVSAGVLVEEPAFAVLIAISGKAPSVTAYSSALACAHAFCDGLRAAARAAMAARPEPQNLTAAELVAAGASALA